MHLDYDAPIRITSHSTAYLVSSRCNYSTHADSAVVYSGPSYEAAAAQISANWQYQTFARWRYVLTHSTEQVRDWVSMQSPISRQWAQSLLWEEAPRQGWGRTLSLTQSHNGQDAQPVLSAVAQLKYAW